MTLAVNGASNTNLTDFYDASVAVGLAAVPAGFTLLYASNQFDPNPAQDTTDGFYAEAFVNASGQVLFAFRGTYPNPTDTYGLGTLKDDAQIMLDKNPPNFTDAVNFVSRVLTQATNLNNTAQGQSQPQPYNLSTIYLTGHSLGGAEAEDVANQVALKNPNLDNFTFDGVTFGAPGLPQNASASPSNTFLDYVDNGDPVANYASDTAAGKAGYAPADMYHFGTVVTTGSGPLFYANPGKALAQIVGSAGIGMYAHSVVESALVLSILGTETGLSHMLNHYGTDLNLQSNPAQKASLDAVDPLVIMEALDGTLGTAGQQDLAAASLSGDGTTLTSPNFTIALNVSANTLTVTQNQAVTYNGTSFAASGDPITFAYDPATFNVTSASWSDPNSGETVVATISPSLQTVTQIAIGNAGSGSVVDNLVEVGQVTVGGQTPSTTGINDIAYDYSGNNGTGTLVQTVIDFSSGGSEVVAPDLPIDLPGLTLSGGASAAGTYTVGSAGATLAQVAAELGMPASLLDALNPSLGATATLASGTAVTLYSQTGWAQSSATLNTQAANGTDLTRFSGSAAAGPSFVYDLANSRELVSASGPNGDTMYIEDEGTLVGVLPAGWLASATTPQGLPGPVTFTGTNGQSVTYAPGSSGGQEIVNGNTVSGAVTVDPSATGSGVTVSDSAGSGTITFDDAASGTGDPDFWTVGSGTDTATLQAGTAVVDFTGGQSQYAVSYTASSQTLAVTDSVAGRNGAKTLTAAGGTASLFFAQGTSSASEIVLGTKTGSDDATTKGALFSEGALMPVTVDGQLTDELTDTAAGSGYIIGATSGETDDIANGSTASNAPSGTIAFADEPMPVTESHSQLWLTKSANGDDLLIDVLGTTEQVDVANWFASGDAYAQVATILASDGTLANAQVAGLVSAMAA